MLLELCSKLNQFHSVQIELPSSKSQSNRALIIQHLCDSSVEIKNLSKANDTLVLSQALKTLPSSIDIAHSGTSFRFLLALLSMNEGQRILTGSKRIQQRPIQELVNCLRSLGVDIQYLQNKYHAPLLIKGKSNIEGGRIYIDASISSQFISALMMIAPYFKNGLILELKNKIVSKSFIQMTVDMMHSFGISVDFNNHEIVVPPGQYKPNTIEIESDYASASYWYSLFSISNNYTEFIFNGLIKNSSQADYEVIELFNKIGIQSTFINDTLVIKKQLNFALPSLIEVDLNNAPDLAQTFVCTCAALDIDLKLTGLETLAHKESNRMQALQTELMKFGKYLNILDHQSLSLTGKFVRNLDVQIMTYEDHRMAMSFAPLSILCKRMLIHEAEVVEKSYPDFWKEISKFAVINKLDDN